jgi:hypothetical protein
MRFYSMSLSRRCPLLEHLVSHNGGTGHELVTRRRLLSRVSKKKVVRNVRFGVWEVLNCCTVEKGEK